MQTFNLVGVTDIKGAVKSEKRRYKRYLDKYNDPATQYAFDVLFTDKYIAGRDAQLACFRHMQDLGRQRDNDFPYHYDTAYVTMIENFTRILPNPDNFKVTLKPYNWQSFILDSLLGWRTEENGTRFTTSNISVARRQGKTFIASMLVNFYYFMVAAEATSQDFLVASYDSEHATKLFNDVSIQAKKLLKMPEFSAWAKENDVDAQTQQVIGRISKNTIRKGTSEGGGFDSFHNVIAVYDEIGNLKPDKNETLRQITSGQNGIKNRMFVKISTAYPNAKVKFKKDQDLMRKIIEQDNLREADNTFQIIYAQDSENEVFEEHTWSKSNPNLNEMDKDKYKSEINSLIKDRDDADRSGELATFVNKSLNIWSRKFQNSYLSLENIQKNIIDDFDIYGRDVYIGFDGSQSNDNTSFGFIFPYREVKRDKYFCKQFSFIPFAQAKTIEAKEKQDGLNYRELEKQGLCEITRSPEGTIDKDQVYHWLEKFVADNDLKVKMIALDPNLSDWLLKRIENYHDEWPVSTVRPTSQVLSNPTKDLQAQFINGNAAILNDPLLIDGFTNAVLIEDRGGAVKIDRLNRTSDHIDTSDALVNAHTGAQFYFEDFKGDDYNPFNDLSRDEKKDYFKRMFG
ncbi:terminase large subunit [Leuconostoc mesenteroides]|uniref:Phage terminase-like protein, large subunit n=1 Tax=Leuconostoc mesenteroides subsp. mesenteroides (strain ATCC 8293 / DSM 20343 / BCRC 11652 / CCM 1803 / JCM 6124 / NCDO 523 / NBRC 100496 / NCIMB 8023 / NCTC 12954 / NRRL B-1118 / 37Y) TaxID=203120 RepID=Q03VN1_LEUMM|nr:terminase TerL endonuclease subunit [Leuconostoc mesenteroides]ABJ62741.1 Phage terminase-like protein, large subunit [Leuconostoc mesenteroides subsp. mesenteroides ATCC 8293]MCT3042536.1 terminase large subunit [Leuconostoc mesenteroides]MDG9747559.1 terminase large subunit [Leuconostoc mesenteroides]QQB30495.1 terminase large subunit [Leuconostoc mesenteroides]SPE14626.1 Phage Terminase [Leuconostoc mesenteroides]